jgi:glutamate-1-semialdehyde 2,1-aminomutase
MKSYLQSDMAFESASKIITGGVNSPVRAFRALERNPLFIEKGKGSQITDIDGNSYIDFCLSWGVHILGHANEKIIEAAKNAIEKSSSFGAPTVLETQLANLIVNAVDSVELVRFVSSGTEAVMSALRLARAFTGRKKIVKFDGCYHGHSDFLLVSAGSGLATQNLSASAGVPSEFTQYTISIPFNSIESIEEVFLKNSDDIAAVILEPIPANMGVVIASADFLETLRQLCTKYNSLLVFDEVITGFRVDAGGAQKLFDIKPDLTTFGKIIGGGFPVGAFGGKKEIMQLLAPVGPVYQAGTLSGNPVAMAAGIAALEQITDPAFHTNLNKKSNKFLKELEQLFAIKGLIFNRFNSMFTPFFSADPVTDFISAKKSDTNRFKNFYLKLLEAGIYLAPSQFEASFISVAHREKDFENVLNAVKFALD